MTLAAQAICWRLMARWQIAMTLPMEENLRLTDRSVRECLTDET